MASSLGLPSGARLCTEARDSRGLARAHPMAPIARAATIRSAARPGARPITADEIRWLEPGITNKVGLRFMPVTELLYLSTFSWMKQQQFRMDAGARSAGKSGLGVLQPFRLSNSEC